MPGGDGTVPDGVFDLPAVAIISPFQAVQDQSNNEQNQNEGNDKRVILKYIHGHRPRASKSANLE
jgi:hypothetical protein